MFLGQVRTVSESRIDDGSWAQHVKWKRGKVEYFLKSALHSTDVWSRNLVTKEYVKLSMRDNKWPRQAIRLARSRTPFVLTSFDAMRAGRLYFTLRERFALKTSVNFELEHAYFDPKFGAD